MKCYKANITVMLTEINRKPQILHSFTFSFKKRNCWKCYSADKNVKRGYKCFSMKHVNEANITLNFLKSNSGKPQTIFSHYPWVTVQRSQVENVLELLRCAGENEFFTFNLKKCRQGKHNSVKFASSEYQ